MYLNLLAHGRERHPLVNSGDMEFINNLIYNYGKMGARCAESVGDVNLSMIGNHYIEGLDNLPTDMLSCNANYKCDNPGTDIYMSDNMENSTIPYPQWDEGKCIPVANRNESPPISSGISAIAVGNIKDTVLVNAGARPADRDAVDKRIVKDVINDTGRIINSPNDVGGWPKLANNYRALTIPSNPNEDNDGDGYTNLEEWLHAFAAGVEGGGSPPAPYPTTKVPDPPTNLKIIN
jgi:hypothetical protein